MGGAGLPLAPQVSELPLRFGLAQSSGPRSRGRPRDRGVTHSCTNPERASDGTGTAVAESLVTLSPSASINSLECKPRDDRWHDVSRHALNKAALQILLRYLRAFCDDDQVALVSLRSALAGSVATQTGCSASSVAIWWTRRPVGGDRSHSCGGCAGSGASASQRMPRGGQTCGPTPGCA